MHTLDILKIKGLKTLDQNNSHNAIVIKFSIFLFISSFSPYNSSLVEVLNNISLLFIFSSIYPLIMGLELLPKSPLGHQMPRWVTYIYIPLIDCIETNLLDRENPLEQFVESPIH